MLHYATVITLPYATLDYNYNCSYNCITQHYASYNNYIKYSYNCNCKYTTL